MNTIDVNEGRQGHLRSWCFQLSKSSKDELEIARNKAKEWAEKQGICVKDENTPWTRNSFTSDQDHMSGMIGSIVI